MSFELHNILSGIESFEIYYIDYKGIHDSSKNKSNFQSFPNESFNFSSVFRQQKGILNKKERSVHSTL